jgi:hypothetical protein
VLKEIILVPTALEIAAGTFRGGRLVRDDAPPVGCQRHGDDEPFGPSRNRGSS